MTDSNPSRQPDCKPYAPPTLAELGTIGAITAGPDSGSLDQLGGSSGGFLIADGTS